MLTVQRLFFVLVILPALMEREIRFFVSSTSSTETFTISPTERTSEGAFIYLSLIARWDQPVLVYADVDQAPKSITLRTVPF